MAYEQLAKRLRFAAGFETDPKWLNAIAGQGLLNEKLHENGPPHPRVQARLHRRILAGLDVEPLQSRELCDEWAAMTDEIDLGRLQHFAGAVWHGNRLRWIVSASDRQEIDKNFGEDFLGKALRYRKLSVVPDEAISVNNVINDITRDGMRCWITWLKTQPKDIAWRLSLLQGPADAEFSPFKGKLADHAAKIVKRLIDDQLARRDKHVGGD